MPPFWMRAAGLCGLLILLTASPPAADEGESDVDLGLSFDRHGTLFTNSVGLELKRVPAGKFMMGSPKTEPDHQAREGPQHEVEIGSFYVGVHEVTQRQYQKVVGKNPSGHQKGGNAADAVRGMDTKDFPVELVSWEEATDFCVKLSALPAEKVAGCRYRLPTEAEWEYCCRAGTKTPYGLGDKLDPKDANVTGTGLGRTCKVGSYKPNRWGLYDFHGNVCEWCSDAYDGNYYKVSPKRDPKGPKANGTYVMRGGCLVYSPTSCRSAARDLGGQNHRVNTVGFRVACDVGR
jgi:formylglycine-generating enzyme required for sulfatase activity